MSPEATRRARRLGFTLVELGVVIVIVGVLAAFGVPRFFRSVERNRAAQAVHYLDAVRAAQERYLGRYGAYAANTSDLDIRMSPPAYFSAGTMGAGDTGTLQSSWTLTLTRIGASAGYNAYTVTFTQGGFDTTNSTLMNLPDVNPMGS